MKIEKNKVVAVDYKLRNSEGGEIVDQTQGDNYLEFLFGRGMLLPKFEENILGLEEGGVAKFHLTPAEGYGEYHNEMVVDLPINIFQKDGVLNEELCHIGNRIPMQDNKGNHLVGKVLEITSQTVKMDFNSDMAGKDLYFEVEVKKVRDASEEEIEHGHVHHDGHCCHGEGHCHKHDGGEGEHHCHKHDGEDGEHHCHKHDGEEGEHHCCHKHDK